MILNYFRNSAIVHEELGDCRRKGIAVTCAVQRSDAIGVSSIHIASLGNQDLYQVSKEDMKTFALIVMNLAREISRRLRTMDTLLASHPESFGV